MCLLDWGLLTVFASHTFTIFSGFAQLIIFKPALGCFPTHTMDTTDFADKEYGPEPPPPTASGDDDENKEYGLPIPPPTARGDDNNSNRLQVANNLDGAPTTNSTGPRDLPRLRHKETKLAQKDAHPWQHLGITLGLPMILLFDIVVPCIIYYTWYTNQWKSWRNQCHDQPSPCPIAPPEQFNKDILGSAIASFGVGELWILLARVYRLFLHPEICAPLLSRNRWELDATSWVYAVAMIIALIPFLVASTMVIPKLYLYGPSFLMGFLGILMVVTTLHPFKIPIGINSQPRGSTLRPFIYYAAEDFMAVDGLQDREFRTRYNDRYESNPMFRRFFFNLTLWWTLGVCVYIGCVSAVIWTLPFHYAFGLSLGVLFSYIICWAVVTSVWVKFEMKREHEAYMRGDFDV